MPGPMLDAGDTKIRYDPDYLVGTPVTGIQGDFLDPQKGGK